MRRIERDRRVHALAVVMLAFAVLAACRKDPAVEGPTSMPTPYAVDLPTWVLDSIGPMPVPPDNPLTVEGVALGRRLFYEKTLSDDGSMSCGSCHLQAAGFGDPRPFSIGTNGAVGRRNAMALVNLAWSQHFFWDGRRASLEEQAYDPVRDMNEMRNTWPVVVQRLQADASYAEDFRRAFGTPGIDSVRVVRALAQFERTLVSFGSRFDRFYFGGDTTALSPLERTGFTVFMDKGLCGRCHIPGLLGREEFSNIGLEHAPLDSGRAEVTGLASDIGKFRTVTLRNMLATAPYMHDGSSESAIDVIQVYNSHLHGTSPNFDTILAPFAAVPGRLQAVEQQALAAFMAAFTDSTFLTDPAFSEP